MSASSSSHTKSAVLPDITVAVEVETYPEVIRYLQVIARQGAADHYGQRHVIFDINVNDRNLWPSLNKVERVVFVYKRPEGVVL